MLPAEIAQAVKRIQFITGRHVSDVMAGAYLSVFKGRGMEFDEVRPYVPGDDIRAIDWNVTARTGEPHIKRFVEERELTVMLLVDVSASQDFGSGRRSKLEAATELSALLAMSAVENGDKVGLLLFHGGPDLYIPPRKGGKHALRVVREVLARGQSADEGVGVRNTWRELSATVRRWFTKMSDTVARAPAATRRSTSISAALEFCRQVLPRRAVLFLISDFLDDNYLKVLRHSNRKHDVVAALITDPREETMPPAGLVTLEDAESGQTRLVDTRSRSFRDELGARAVSRRKELHDQLRATGMDLVVFDASGSMVDPLLKFFRERERRLRR
ncbi:MAG: DUF58 domain-containing protein [Myxococcota bacterium]|nr:DUF58 domain-containing protein [Deltaproteobacteria bacterium]MDQ3341415.1 DUF58 domain-containing protein [Myxococcota bacterium]